MLHLLPRKPLVIFIVLLLGVGFTQALAEDAASGKLTNAPSILEQARKDAEKMTLSTQFPPGIQL
jgi:hypothetical protein